MQIEAVQAVLAEIGADAALFACRADFLVGPRSTFASSAVGVRSAG